MITATTDNSFTTRTILAMRDEVQKQCESAERVRVMFNALAVEHGIDPVKG